MVEFIIGASGTGKTSKMFNFIRSNAQYGIEQCILVPENYSHEFDKNLYNYLGAKQFNALLSLTFKSVSRHIYKLYGDPYRNGEFADEMSRMIIIYQAIEAASQKPEMLKYYRRNYNQPGFAEEVLKVISSFKQAGISPDDLIIKTDMLDSRLRDKTCDIASIFSEYIRLMNEYDYKDNYENIRFAAKTANLHQFFKNKYVYLDEFEMFTGEQLEMIEVIISSAKKVFITLRTENISDSKYSLFETVNQTFRKLTTICRQNNIKYSIHKCCGNNRFKTKDLSYLSDNILRNHSFNKINAPFAENIHIFEARDMYSEIEYVCAEIKRLIAINDGVKYSDIAIISNNISDYSDLLKAAFSRYEIPYFLSLERSVNHTAIMVFFISLLDLLTARSIKSEQVFRLLKCGILDIELTDVSLLENYCYRWSIDGDIWLSEFTADDPNLELLEDLRFRVINPIINLKNTFKRNISASVACSKLYNYLQECNAEQNLSLLIAKLIKNNRDYYAAELKRLWKCLMDILDSIVSTLGDEEISFNRLANIIRSFISQLTYSVPPQTLDAVIAAASGAARLNSPKIIFSIGSNEGDFPKQVNINGLFSDNDRQKLYNIGLDFSRSLSELLSYERFIVYKCLSTASEKLYLSYPLSDLSGQAKYPSQIVDQIRKMYANEILITEDDVTPEHYAVTYHAAYYHYMQNKTDNTNVIASIGKVLLSDPIYNNRILSVLKRTNNQSETRIESDIIKKLKCFTPLFISPTALENYNNCHFMHFCNDFLRLQIPEKMDLDIRITGELTHSCFYSLLYKRKKSDFIKLDINTLKNEIKAEAEKYKVEHLAGDFAKTPRFELLFNKLEERLTEVFLHTQQSLMASDFEPIRFEYDMRNHNALSLKFSNEEYELKFGGIADRIDYCHINGKDYISVIDYKSSEKTIDEYTLASGQNLQMLLYLFAVTEKGSEFEGYSPAGVLYTPIQIGELEAEESKIDTYNQICVDSKLKTKGLVVDDVSVANAMEHDVKGRFIPVKLTSKGLFDSRSSVIPQSNIACLRNYVYSTLIGSAESMLDGCIDAIPLKNGKKSPCNYCNYSDICGNNDNILIKQPTEDKIVEAAEILGKKMKGSKL